MRKQREKTIVVIMVLAAMALLGVIVSGCRKSPEHQRTNCEWEGEYIEDLISELCCRYGVDYEDNWVFHCPECVGASYTNFKDGGSLIKGWLFVGREVIEKIEPGEEVEVHPFYKTDVYCNVCEYPLGYDWVLIDFSEKTKKEDIFSRFPLIEPAGRGLSNQ